MTPPADPRHQRFADRRLAGDSIVDAYLAAGYKCSRSSAMHAGQRLAKRKDVRDYTAAVQARAADDSVMTVLEIRRFLARIKRTPITAMHPDSEENADLIKSYSTTTGEMSSSFRLEKLDPLKAVEIDLKLSGNDPELNNLKLISDAITALGEGPIPSDRMPE